MKSQHSYSAPYTGLDTEAGLVAPAGTSTPPRSRCIPALNSRSRLGTRGGARVGAAVVVTRGGIPLAERGRQRGRRPLVQRRIARRARDRWARADRGDGPLTRLAARGALAGRRASRGGSAGTARLLSGR